MTSIYKRCVAAVSGIALVLIAPTVAVAKAAGAVETPQEVTIEIVTEDFGIEITICVGRVC